MRRLVPIVVALTIISGLAAGCQAKRVEGEPLKPKVAPPLIAKKGELAVGVDPSYPPFAGKVSGKLVGLDADVAAALADRLGLRLRLVPVSADDMAKALRDRRIDVGLGGIPITSEILAEAGFAGSYATNAPALFATEDATLTVGTLGKRVVGAQEGSLAYWRLESDLGAGYVKAYPTLREAFADLDAGKLDVVAADAMVGAYLSRDFDDVRFVGQVRPATPLAVAVAEDAPEFESIVRDTLDAMAAEGVLEVIRSKWTGGLPELAGDNTSTPAP